VYNSNCSFVQIQGSSETLCIHTTHYTHPHYTLHISTVHTTHIHTTHYTHPHYTHPQYTLHTSTLHTTHIHSTPQTIIQSAERYYWKNEVSTFLCSLYIILKFQHQAAINPQMCTVHDSSAKQNSVFKRNMLSKLLQKT